MSLLTSREVWLAKIEVTYNVDPVPVASTDAILVENPAWAHESARMNERPALRPSIGKLQQVYGGTLVTLTGDVELKGAGAAYSASVRPEIDVLFRICGLSSTVDASPGTESVTYAPASSGHESATIYYYQDGTRMIATGCRGNVSIAAEVGGLAKASFTITGHVAGPADVALPAPTYDSALPPAVKAGAFTIDGFSAVIATLNVDLGNTVAMPPDLSASDGFGEVQITSRDVNGSFDPEYPLVASEDFVGNWKSGLAMVLATGTIGGTQYNRYAVDMPALYYREVAPGDRDGIRTLDLTFGAVESTGDDEVTITFN